MASERQMGRYERLCYERHKKDLALCEQPGGHPKGFHFDQKAAERIVFFIEKWCHHWKGQWAGNLVLLEEWQKAILWILFGWKRADGTRRFRKAYIELARKQGKTTLAAAIALYMLMADGEPGAECYSTATSKEQAKILFTDAVQMVKRSPDLSEYVKYYRSAGGTLYCEEFQSKLTPLSADSGTKDGLNPHFDGRDEVHEWKDHELAAKLDTAMGARRQPLTLEITTAGVYDVESVGWKHHEYATQVLDGLFEDDRQFAFIAAVDDGDDPLHDPSCWGKANPNLGVSCKKEFLKEQVAEALNRPDEANKILRMHFGKWTAQLTRWLDVERWKDSDPISGIQALAQREMRERLLEGRVAYGGIDLSSKNDLTALVLVFPADDGYLDFIARFYLPADTIERELKIRGRRHYRDWVDAGWITQTPGTYVDYGWIRRDANEFARRYKVKEWAFDPANATQIACDLMTDGLAVCEVRQGPMSLSEACKVLEAKILARQVRHGGNPVATWCVGNAVKREDCNANIAPDKKKAKDKIDFVSAAVTAMSRYVVGAKPLGDPPARSYLERGELAVV